MRRNLNKRSLSLLLCLALLLPMLLTLGGCGGSPETPGTPSPTAAPAPAAEAPKLPPAEMLAVSVTPDPALAGDAAAAALGFAADLLRQTAGDNRLISPISVLCALGMVLNGAAGETRSQMEAALGISGEALNAYLGPWLAALAAAEESELRVADGIWCTDDAGVHISEDFLRLNREYYGAGVEQCPLDAAALARINAFVNTNTRGMIEKILDNIPREAVMILVNALSFEAEWETPYREDQVLPGVFTAENGEEQTVEFLHHGEQVFLEDENTTGFMKYYAGKRYAFAALLPAEGTSVEDYAATLTGEKLLGLLAGARWTTVLTATPKFETDYAVSLNETLQALGMRDAFDGGRADFSALGTCDGGANIYLSQVVHKTYLKLDEKGTRAGAATSAIMYATSALAESPPQVILDRPFVYLLLDTETNLPLFIGIVSSVG